MTKRKPPIPYPYFDRIANVRKAMIAQKVDAYFIQNRMDQYWLTGFTGEDGGVLLTKRTVALLTDGRFDETADNQAPYAKKVIRKKRGSESIVSEVKKLRISKLGFNPSQMDVKTFTELRKALTATKLVAVTDVIRKFREIKDETELTTIRKSIDVAERAFKKVQRWIRPGLTEKQVAAKLVYEMQCLGAQGPSFPPIVGSGPNASEPHYEPGDRKLRHGEPVLIDWGAQVDWYASDLTRIVWVGSIPRQIAKIYDIVREAQARAIAAVGPGVPTADVDKAARSYITEKGYGKQFNHGIGHGLGLHVHDVMTLGRKGKNTLKPGMVITIEPGIYLPGKGGVRLEDDVLVTETGHEVLSSLPLDRPK